MLAEVRSDDRRLSLVKMPRQGRNKRKRPPEEMPSSQTLEFVLHVRRGGNVIKKRTVEKMEFSAMDSPVNFPDDNVLPTPSPQSDPSVPVDGTSGDASTDAASRSVSVSLIFICHVVSTYTPSRPKYKSGFCTARSSSTNLCASKPPHPKIQPALRASPPRSIVA